jgi:hypothetical protein
MFTQLSAYRGGFVNVTAGPELERRLVQQVPYVQASANFFTLFGATVAQGRGSGRHRRPGVLGHAGGLGAAAARDAIAESGQRHARRGAPRAAA